MNKTNINAIKFYLITLQFNLLWQKMLFSNVLYCVESTETPVTVLPFEYVRHVDSSNLETELNVIVNIISCRDECHVWEYY